MRTVRGTAVATAVGLALAAALPAADGPPLTVSEAVALAAGGAPSLARSRAGAEAARARQKAARSRLWPWLSVEAGFLGTNDPVDAFALSLKQQRFSLVEFAAGDPNHPPFTKDWSAGVAAAWSIDLFGSARSEASGAESAAEAADREAARTRDAAAFEAIEAFAAARRAEESISLLALRVSDAEKDVSIARSLHEQGLTTAADPARAEAALAEVRAQTAAEEAARASARARLAVLIGTEAASRPLAELPPPRPVPETGPPVRDDVAAADLARQAAEEGAKAASAARFPSLTVQGRYDLHAPEPGGRWGDSGSVFAGVRVPLFASGGIDARVAEARARARAAEADAQATRRDAEKDTATARAALVAAAARLEAFTESEAAARRAREIQQARYEEGVARLSDLLEARTAELHARLGATSARSERTVSEARLRLALGLPPEGEERK
jgi:outer membrane protein TolC